MNWGEPNRKRIFATLVPAPASASKLTRAHAAAPHLYARMLEASYGALKGVSTRKPGDRGQLLHDRGHLDPNVDPVPASARQTSAARMDVYGQNPVCFRAPDLRNPLAGQRG